MSPIQFFRTLSLGGGIVEEDNNVVYHHSPSNSNTKNESFIKHSQSTSSTTSLDSFASGSGDTAASNSTGISSLTTSSRNCDRTTTALDSETASDNKSSNGSFDIRSASDEELLGGEPNLLNRDVELQGVKEIIRALAPEQIEQLPDPRMPIRHLRAEKGDVHKAIEKLKFALKWREDFQVNRLIRCMDPSSNDEELKEIMEFENATGKVYVRGHDKDGRSLVYMYPTRSNSDHLINNMRHLVWNLEKAMACTKRKSVELNSGRNNGQPLDKHCLLVDYTGYQMKHMPPMSVTKYTLDILQKHYPERMYRIYVLHPPMAFRIFWNLIKHFVDPVSKSKIVLCPPGGEGMKQLQDDMGGQENYYKLEKCAGNSSRPVKEFSSKEYLNLPFDICYDA